MSSGFPMQEMKPPTFQRESNNHGMGMENVRNQKNKSEK